MAQSRLTLAGGWLSGVLVLIGMMPAATGGSIAGKVVDAGGRLDNSVVIVFTRVTMATKAGGPQTGAAAVDKSGAFQIDALETGTYALCVQGGDHEYLDPCIWSAAPTVELKNAKDQSAITIELERGVRLRLEFKDPKALLARADRPKAPNHANPGIWKANGFFVPIPEKSHDASGQVHEMKVPAGQSLHLQVGEEGLQLTKKGSEPTQRGRNSVAVITRKDEPLKTLEFTADQP